MSDLSYHYYYQHHCHDLLFIKAAQQCASEAAELHSQIKVITEQPLLSEESVDQIPNPSPAFHCNPVIRRTILCISWVAKLQIQFLAEQTVFHTKKLCTCSIAVCLLYILEASLM